MILPHVPRDALPALHAALREGRGPGHGECRAGIGHHRLPRHGLLRAGHGPERSPSPRRSPTRIDALKLEHEVGPLKIKISGCINACGHHHVGHIGILGLDRAGVENYQITLGGDHTEQAAIGKIAGHGFAYDQIVPAIERLILAYLDLPRGAGGNLHRRLSPPRRRAVQIRPLRPGDTGCRLTPMPF